VQVTSPEGVSSQCIDCACGYSSPSRRRREPVRNLSIGKVQGEIPEQLTSRGIADRPADMARIIGIASNRFRHGCRREVRRLGRVLLDIRARAIIGDGNALAVEINLYRHTYKMPRPHQALDDRTPRQAYLSSLASQ
jgi:hypothetical protein